MSNDCKKKISITTSCFNEEMNLWELYDRVTAVIDRFPEYNFEFILADNGSTDHTQDILRAMAKKDDRVKVLINVRNFGLDCSGYNSLRAATGDCVISTVSDLQDPPELIEDFIKKWQEGSKVVIAVKNKSKENPLMYAIRKKYYRVLNKISDTEQIENFTGFGLYDKSIAKILTQNEWPVPYFRGLVSEIGIEPYIVYYTQEKRHGGKSSYNLFSYFDAAMTGVTAHSKMPLRFATMLGIVLSIISMVVALVYLILKLMFWNRIPVGIVPLAIGLFLFLSIQILLIGLVGEYVLQNLEYLRKKPLVIVKEKIGFADESTREMED
jgi:glycosyltransferase involved in cell wall biosynthesis